jgi:hypothetical protein
MNPFQHSAVAATIYKVLEEFEEKTNLRAGQEVLGELACTLAEVLTETHRVKLGKPPDDVVDWLNDSGCSNKGFLVAWLRNAIKKDHRGKWKRA